jgi:hypothetical protein
MLKYVINRLMHAFFHFRTVIIPRPILTLGLKPSGRYRSLGMITVLIWKRACINLSARLDYSCETGWNKHDSSYYSKQNSIYIYIWCGFKSRRGKNKNLTTPNLWIWVINIGWGPVDNSPIMEKVMHWSIYRKAWYHVIRFLPNSNNSSPFRLRFSPPSGG